ncbi:glycosyltransferase [Vasconcelosia minhoensis]|nr:glycosyltransferase [Romeria gracilis]
MGRIGGSFYPTHIEPSPQDCNILLMMDTSANALKKVASIANWRQKFDIVAAYVEDCWLLDSFPHAVKQFDRLFIPHVEFQSQLEQQLNIPVSVLPCAFDVLTHGAGIKPRTVDVFSYGRTPRNYYLELQSILNAAGSGCFYYHQTFDQKELFPKLTYCSERFDYLHRLQLKKLLKRSKLTLAFDFSYTVPRAALHESMKFHPSHKCGQSVLNRRWFEGAAAGTVLVGKRPQTEMMSQYFDWEDATIELPDQPAEGAELIQDLLSDRERLEAVSQRNYVQSLAKNDWRLRIRDMLKQLDIPLPSGLELELEQLQRKIHSLRPSLAT